MADTTDLKARETHLFHQWRTTQKPQYFQELYRSMRPLIHTAAKKASMGSNLPESAHKAYAAQAFLDALRTYDPKKGAGLSTHVVASVGQKVKRLNYTYQNLGAMPEPRAQIVGTYQTIYGNLRSELGREPSTAEMADKLSMGIKQVANLQRELRKDLALGEGTEEVAYNEGSKDEEKLNFLYYDLAPDEKVVYEYVFGKFGKPRLTKPGGKVDFDRIAQATSLPASRVHNLFLKIRDKYKRVF